MKSPSKRPWLCYAVSTAAVTVILAWPVGTWLGCRKMQVKGNEFLPDAVYLVAGASDQARRIVALVDFWRDYTVVSTQAENAVILIGNDGVIGRWSSEDQRNLMKAEWAKKIVAQQINQICGASAGVSGIEVIPEKSSGTDGEMEAMVRYLDDHRDLRRLVVVTSPFHVRRLLWRLSKYLSRPIEVKVVIAKRRWNDRAPWTVLVELFKMVRDGLGLSRAPILSRRIR